MASRSDRAFWTFVMAIVIGVSLATLIDPADHVHKLAVAALAAVAAAVVVEVFRDAR